MIDIGQLKTADIKALLEQNPADIMALLQAMKEDRRLSVQKLADTYIRRKMKEEATPVISRDDVPIIDQVAAAEVSQVENMNPDVPIPDEVIERVASIHERVEEHRANRGLKPSLHGFFFRGKKR